MGLLKSWSRKWNFLLNLSWITLLFQILHRTKKCYNCKQNPIDKNLSSTVSPSLLYFKTKTYQIHRTKTLFSKNYCQQLPLYFTPFSNKVTSSSQLTHSGVSSTYYDVAIKFVEIVWKVCSWVKLCWTRQK